MFHVNHLPADDSHEILSLIFHKNEDRYHKMCPLLYSWLGLEWSTHYHLVEQCASRFVKIHFLMKGVLYHFLPLFFSRERSGLVVECLTWDQKAAGLSLTSVTALCPWARHINPSLELVQPRKTHPYITERLLMGHKESNQKKKKKKSSWKPTSEYDQEMPQS